MRLSVTLAEFSSRLRLLGPKMRRATVRGLRSGAMRLRAAVAFTIRETKPYAPVDEGTYAASFGVERLANGARVESAVPHAEWIEVGRRPGPVPLKPILEWVKRKRLYEDEVAKMRAHLGRRIPKRELIDEAALRVARRIRDAIQRKGFAPRFPMRRALRSSQRDVELAILFALGDLDP